jgi:hypothetical protein
MLRGTAVAQPCNWRPSTFPRRQTPPSAIKFPSTGGLGALGSFLSMMAARVRGRAFTLFQFILFAIRALVDCNGFHPLFFVLL